MIVLCLLNYDGQQLLRKRQEALCYSCIFLKINKMIVVYTHCFYTVRSLFKMCQNVSSLIYETDLLHTNKFIRVFLATSNFTLSPTFTFTFIFNYCLVWVFITWGSFKSSLESAFNTLWFHLFVGFNLPTQYTEFILFETIDNI